MREHPMVHDCTTPDSQCPQPTTRHTQRLAQHRVRDESSKLRGPFAQPVPSAAELHTRHIR